MRVHRGAILVVLALALALPLALPLLLFLSLALPLLLSLALLRLLLGGRRRERLRLGVQLLPAEDVALEGFEVVRMDLPHARGVDVAVVEGDDAIRVAVEGDAEGDLALLQ